MAVEKTLHRFYQHNIVRNTTHPRGKGEPRTTNSNRATDITDEIIRQQSRHTQFAQRFAIESLLVGIGFEALFLRGG